MSRVCVLLAVVLSVVLAQDEPASNGLSAGADEILTSPYKARTYNKDLQSGQRPMILNGKYIVTLIIILCTFVFSITLFFSK